MGFFSSLEISASALSAQRLRMDVISENLANVDTVETENGEPYRRKYVVLGEKNSGPSFATLLEGEKRSRNTGGVRVVSIGEDPAEFRLEYDPTHPNADENGFVEKPNVDFAQEMVDMIAAYRSYEANVTAFNATKDMAVKALEIGS
jgi:flagellar basal-body rod protein FlgC